MDINYTWHFGPFECVPKLNSLNNVVEKIYWRLYGSVEDHTAEANGIVTLETVQTESFILFQELTEEIVKEWVTSRLGMDIIYADIERQLDILVNPRKTVLNAPWTLV